MGESSDPLLLSKAAQKLVKGSDDIPGTLSITQSKIKWKPNDMNAAEQVTIEIASITKQQQAPGKPFLRILSPTEPLGLAFASEADKNEVLDLMKQLKPPPAAAPKDARAAGLPSEAQKRQLFASDKDLEALYGQLVTSGILSESDFWRTRQSALSKLSGQTGPKQPIGLSSVMHEVEQLHDGQTERVNIHLTPRDIQRVFLERPEVHRAFMAHVPHSLSETEFWQKYFKLEYKKAAKRKHLASSGRFDVADEELDEGDELFAPFRKQLLEQDAVAAKAKVKRVDPTVNLVAELGDGWSTGEFGVGQGAVNGELGPVGTAKMGKKVSVLESIAKDLNRHAAQVLDGALDGLAEENAGGDTASIAAKVAAAVQSRAKLQGSGKQGTAAAAAGGTAEEEVTKEKLEEWQARAASALEDLSLETKVETVPLDVHDPRAYFGTTAGTSGAISPKDGTTEMDVTGDLEAHAAKLRALVDRIDATTLPNPPCAPSIALSALMGIGGEEDQGLIRQFGPVAAVAVGKHPKDALGSVMVEFFRMEALKTNELLRHLWGSLPIVSDNRRQKGSKLAKHLEDQRKSLAAHMASGSGSAQQVHVTQMVRPLVEAIDAALERYNAELQGGGLSGS